MRNARLARASLCGAVVAAASLWALLGAMQTSAQNPYPPPAPPAGSPTAKAASVVITGMSTSAYSFQPRTLKVRAGARVTWAWQSNAPHNVTFGKLGKHSMTGQTETFKLRFKHAGIFHYFCSVHGFTGKIVVHK